MSVLVALLAIGAGILNTVQTGANASLNKALGQPILAALIGAATNAALYLLAASPSSASVGPGAASLRAYPGGHGSAEPWVAPTFWR